MVSMVDWSPGASVLSDIGFWWPVLLGAFNSLADDHEMSFSYQMGANPGIDYIRLLIADTVETDHIFEDSEIESAKQIQGSFFQSSMFYSPPAGRDVPSSPISYLRVAALLLDCIAANKSRLASIMQLLDVKVDAGKASYALRMQADEYRQMDDNTGAFVIIEQVNTTWNFADRFWNQVQRQQGSGF